MATERVCISVQPDDLTSQIEKEAAEIKAAPAVPVGPIVGRCHFCGALSRDLYWVETVGEPGSQVDRVRGRDCCG